MPGGGPGGAAPGGGTGIADGEVAAGAVNAVPHDWQ